MHHFSRQWIAAVSVILTVLTTSWATTTAAVTLLGTTAYFMGGTEHPLVDPHRPGPPVGSRASHQLSEHDFAVHYVRSGRDNFLIPTAALRGDDMTGPVGDSAVAEATDYTVIAAYTPAAMRPVFGDRTFDQSVQAGVVNMRGCLASGPCIAHSFTPEELAGPAGIDDTTAAVVIGYSQSARTASVVKAALIEQHRDDWTTAPDVSFVLLANPNRPNGGVLQRFAGLYIPLLDVTFDGATATDSCDEIGCHFPTVDISRQYDGWSDFPRYPLNLLATVNAIAGIITVHPDYDQTLDPQTMYQGAAGDTSYYLLPAGRLPILAPLALLGVPSPILTALDAPLRVIVEWGYDRDPAQLGVPTRAGLFPIRNPLSDLVNLLVAIPTGIDDAIAEATGNIAARPFATTRSVSPFGVGGDPLPTPNAGPAPVDENSDAAMEETAETAETDEPPVRAPRRGWKRQQADDPPAKQPAESESGQVDDVQIDEDVMDDDQIDHAQIDEGEIPDEDETPDDETADEDAADEDAAA